MAYNTLMHEKCTIRKGEDGEAEMKTLIESWRQVRASREHRGSAPEQLMKVRRACPLQHRERGFASLGWHHGIERFVPNRDGRFFC